jgi:hypothetical protein
VAHLDRPPEPGGDDEALGGTVGLGHPGALEARPVTGEATGDDDPGGELAAQPPHERATVDSQAVGQHEHGAQIGRDEVAGQGRAGGEGILGPVHVSPGQVDLRAVEARDAHDQAVVQQARTEDLARARAADEARLWIGSAQLGQRRPGHGRIGSPERDDQRPRRVEGGKLVDGPAGRRAVERGEIGHGNPPALASTQAAADLNVPVTPWKA